jgi:hypothetical protein
MPTTSPAASAVNVVPVMANTLAHGTDNAWEAPGAPLGP